MNNLPDFTGLLVIPHLRIQNANAVSSSMTWGFPSMTAFIGLMWALQRKSAAFCKLDFHAVGVVCHAFEPQVGGRYVRSFCLSRNPPKKVNADGSTVPASIIEEGRAHMEISLVFAVAGADMEKTEEEKKNLALEIQNTLLHMRVAGGSILPTNPKLAPQLLLIDPNEQHEYFVALRRNARLLPGFTLISREGLLLSRQKELYTKNQNSSLLDAWLDLSRRNWRAEREPDQAAETATAQVTWRQTRPKKGWIVPIPVGYAAISPLYAPSTVENARDTSTPFRFVESLYSIGEWVGVHRIEDARDLLWYAQYDKENGVYVCRNDCN